MAAPTNLPRLDPPIAYHDLSPEMVRWLSDVVDLFNQTVQQIENVFSTLITAAGVNVGGSGAGPISVPVTGLTSSGVINATLISSSNAVTIANVTPGTNAFSITFNADPGASAIIVYQAYTQSS